ncbi:MAG: hypothetical protein ACOCY6_00260 [Halodesulfurarchaeum sp.]
MIASENLDTGAILERAQEYARANEIEDVVVASTSGETGVRAVETFDTDVRNVVVVAHASGYRDPNTQEFESEYREQIEASGGTVFVGPMVMSNIGSAIAKKEGFSANELVADVLRLFGQGTKVALECVLMACDAGVIPSEREVLSVAGTGSGADTVLSIHSANSRDLFDARIREVLVKPTDPENMFFW